MNQTIQMTLNPASIDAGIAELRAYQRRLEVRCEELRQRVAYFIARDASAVFNTAVADDLIGEGVVTGSVQVSVESGGNNTTLVIASGKDAVFMEFGAGVYNNGAVGSAPNPWGSNFGFTIGSYGKGNGRREIWGYRGEDGEVHLTHGTPASMPLYKAVMSVRRDLERIAMEVFAT